MKSGLRAVIVFLSALMAAAAAHAGAAPDVRWARSFGNATLTAYPLGVAPDGSLGVAGWFSTNRVVLGTNELVNQGTNYSDIFVARLDKTGGVLWARSAGSPEWDEAHGVTFDDTGHLYVTGFVRTNSSFGTTNFAAGGAFLAKYSPEGTLLWVRLVSSGTLPLPAGRRVVARGTNIYWVGSSAGGLIIGPTTVPNIALFVIRCDREGNIHAIHDLGHNMGGFGLPVSTSFDIDAEGNWIVECGFNGNQFLFGGTNVTRISSFGREDGLLTKWNSNGQLLWFHHWAGEMIAGLGPVHFNRGGDLTVTGGPFPRGTFAGQTVTNFVARLAPDGTVRWIKHHSRDLSILSAASDRAENSIVAGLAFAPGGLFGNYFIPSTSGAGVPWIGKVSSDGEVLWASAAAQIGADTQRYPYWMTVCVTPSGAPVLSGFYGAALQFGSYALPAAQRGDSFVVQWNPESPRLDVQRQAGDMVVSWSAHQVGFNLESANVSQGPWQPVPNPPHLLSNRFVSTNSAGPGTEFYRLRWEP